MHLGKDETSDSSKCHWLLHDSDINSTRICTEINGLGLTEFWLKLYHTSMFLTNQIAQLQVVLINYTTAESTYTTSESTYTNSDFIDKMN